LGIPIKVPNTVYDIAFRYSEDLNCPKYDDWLKSLRHETPKTSINNQRI
jgi:hypothetical protein